MIETLTRIRTQRYTSFMRFRVTPLGKKTEVLFYLAGRRHLGRILGILRADQGLPVYKVKFDKSTEEEALAEVRHDEIAGLAKDAREVQDDKWE